jgi:hypothetical protein
MKNIKFLTLTIIMFLAVSVSQSSAQIGPQFLDIGPCTYDITLQNEGLRKGRVLVNVILTGLNLDISVNGYDFTLNQPTIINQPITVYPPNAAALNFGNNLQVADIKSSRVTVSVNGTPVCFPGQTRRVYFNLDGCTFYQ